jgi:hypothetical protein
VKPVQSQTQPQPPTSVAKENDSSPNSLIFRQLGDLALKSLNNGEPVRDEIIVHILVEKIKTLSQDKGFIIDGFPTTFEQAKLLEKALSGYDEDHPVLPKPKRESILAPNPKPEPPKPKHQSAIDLIVYLDLSNEVVLKRSVGRYCNFIFDFFFKFRFTFLIINCCLKMVRFLTICITNSSILHLRDLIRA